ncbi:type II toxin-antitoxin system RelE/ParE family toxin [Pedobacter cryophilus]|uniref:Type II toxin-antitoxin system RelE/ParE family toxin n=1 Tax=Pedobacter cryophilus TaxID=2571271 RepID=A0A4U1C3D0_9SPHI|nr:type II toxin-antitoxin system RelE/ParE family toxin [Pedobacter cryophilus]TKB97704.1 type II toxin-antitoxin system RelE/ParE family toxin [Pedobacter cryophilus]
MKVKSIIWTQRALSEYDLLVEYLFDEWGEKITIEISQSIDKYLIRIENSPKQFPIINREKIIRKCVISKQTSLFFMVLENRIVILSLFDNRQNPKNLNL